MMESKLIKKIEALILPILESQNIDLVEIELKGKLGAQVLRIFVDIEGGISLDQCVNLSRDIADLLDTKDLITGHYRLEVSSPGLDRPLRTERDFERNLGRKVKIDFLTDVGENMTITGTMKQVDDNAVVIMQNNHQFKIDISKISVAKVLPTW